MSTSSLNNKSGYYGKVPLLGDFIKHNLPRSFIEPWDEWLQHAIIQSKQKLSDKWLDFFLTSPVYYYALSPGICGENGWLGVMMPSVDRVGRYFPLTLCSPLPVGDNPLQALINQQTWLSRAEQLLLSGLENEFSVERFNQQIQALELDTNPNRTSQETMLELADEASDQTLVLRHALSSINELPSIGISLLHKLLTETCFAYSLWWTAGSESISPSLLISQGFPPIASVAALFDGRWEHWGWQDQPVNQQLNVKTSI